MADGPLKTAIQGLTLGRIEEGAVEPLEQLLRQGFEAVREQDFPVYRYLKDVQQGVLEREGLVDAWLSFICLCTFANGVAAGRGAKTINVSDVDKTRDTTCDEWPKCVVMRLEEFSRAFSSVMEAYDKLG